MKELISFLLLITFGGFPFLHAQIRPTVNDSLPQRDFRIVGDSIYAPVIPLQEVYLFGRLEFKDREDRMKYYILRRKTLKVYPYAKLAADRLVSLKDSLSLIKRRRHQKRYTKKVHKYIEEEFSEELKKLTRTEGQILVKLIHRQTGETSYELVRELRSGWRAFWYQTTAKAFKIDLKTEFNPESVHEDYLIEDILQRAFAYGLLERQPSALDYDYGTLSNKWKQSMETAGN